MTARVWNITLRTAHIAAMGILLGGHAFDVSPERLRLSLWLTIGTGLVLAVIEAWPRLVWFHQGRGVMTLAKLALLCVVPLVWDHRLWVLLAIIVLGSVGSHMPARFRYYSVLRREVMPNTCGPGLKETNS
jgi:hypothetical protein